MSATPFKFISKKIIVLVLIAWTLTFSCSALAQTKNKDPLFAQGKDYFSAGDLNRALSCFRQYEALQPNNIAVHFYIGLILDQTGDSKAALGEYNQCLAQASSIGTDSAETFAGTAAAIIAEATTIIVKRRASTRAKTAWSVASAEST